MGQRGPLPANVLPGPGSEGAVSEGPTTAQHVMDKRAPNPPTWLAREARAEWRRVVPQLERNGLLAYALDRGLLAEYCTLWDQWAQATRAVQREGEALRQRAEEAEEQLRRGEAEGWPGGADVRDRLIRQHRLLLQAKAYGGQLVPGDRGLVKNPAMQVQRDLHGQVLALRRELLLTPVARLRVELKERDADADDGALD